MLQDLVLVDHSGPAALVTLNRPGKRNALSIELRRTLAQTLESLAADPAINAIGLTGAGSAFCAGMDVATCWARRNARCVPPCSARHRDV